MKYFLPDISVELLELMLPAFKVSALILGVEAI
jgi:hypothetical protein